VDANTLGDAGNVVKNPIALRASVELPSVIGDCKTSLEVKSLLGQVQVSTDSLIESKERDRETD
jgi:bifunctional ADP-heptose synthase (sugar kinase/adenylyltransferase)